MEQGSIQRLIRVFMAIADEKRLSCECGDLERIAVLVHRVMSYQSREFHTLEHVFGFLDEGSGLHRDPELVLAAIFHDLIYYQVDDGVTPEIESLLDDYLELREGQVFLRSTVSPEDLPFRVTRALFGFEAGRAVQSFGGLNEFLSTLVMLRLLVDHFPLAELLAAAACIAASQPFRGPDAQGRSMAALLERRLAAIAESERLILDQAALQAMIHRAVAFANADVRDFRLDDPARFLSNTWKLLPESNAPLRRHGAFSIVEYRQALQKMLAFFRHLDPATIFHDYRGVPSAGELEALEATARRNLACGRAYLRAKLLAVGLLEAVALVSGGDAPMALFMGEVPERPHEGADPPQGEAVPRETLMSYLPERPAPARLHTRHAVYRLLKDGRLEASSFDLKNSPLALYLYHRLEPAAWIERVKTSELFFSGDRSAEEFLLGFAPALRMELFEACASMVPTRRRPLAAWLAAHDAPDSVA
ncbi:MAG: hypothetical protein JNG85_03170 [Spirochaetaceae bacterium]|nr:hypothetical protein [Spirochaetaceae bacterium]